LSDLIFVPLNVLDGWLSGWLPDLARICIWGIVSGCAAMLLYYATSNQAAITSLKKETRDLRNRMLKDDLQYSEVMRLAKNNLSTSIRLLGKVLTPSLLASAPVLVPVLWLATYQSYGLPPAGESVNVTVTPHTSNLQFAPSDRFAYIGDDIRFLAAPDVGPVSIMGGARLVYQGDPTDPPSPVLYKRHWWNSILKNPVGYIDPDSVVHEIRWDFPRKRLMAEGVPGWAATWEVPFFLFVFVAAIVLKVVLRIQ